MGVVVKHVRTTKTITSLALLSRTAPMEDMHLPPGPSYPDLLWLTWNAVLGLVASEMHFWQSRGEET